MFALLITGSAVLLGIAIGSIPGLNEHLHWNLWVLLPVSGMLFGAAFAWGEFLCARLIRKPMSIGLGRLLAVGIAVAYFTTDIGVYFSLHLPISGSQALPDGIYPVRELVSFLEFMTWRLGSSSIQSLHLGSIQLGEAGTIFSYLFDLLGAGLGAFVTFNSLIFKTPYCSRCARYMNTVRSFEIHLSRDAAFENIRTIVQNLSQQRQIDALLKFLEDLPQAVDREFSRARISAVHGVCPGCGAVAISGEFFQVERHDLTQRPRSTFSALCPNVNDVSL